MLAHDTETVSCLLWLPARNKRLATSTSALEWCRCGTNTELTRIIRFYSETVHAL